MAKPGPSAPNSGITVRMMEATAASSRGSMGRRTRVSVLVLMGTATFHSPRRRASGGVGCVPERAPGVHPGAQVTPARRTGAGRPRGADSHAPGFRGILRGTSVVTRGDMYCPDCRQERLGTARHCALCGTTMALRPRNAVEAELAHVHFLLDELKRWDSSEVPRNVSRFLSERYEDRPYILLSVLTEMPVDAMGRVPVTSEAAVAPHETVAAPVPVDAVARTVEPVEAAVPAEAVAPVAQSVEAAASAEAVAPVAQPVEAAPASLLLRRKLLNPSRSRRHARRSLPRRKPLNPSRSPRRRARRSLLLRRRMWRRLLRPRKTTRGKSRPASPRRAHRGCLVPAACRCRRIRPRRTRSLRSRAPPPRASSRRPPPGTGCGGRSSTRASCGSSVPSSSSRAPSTSSSRAGRGCPPASARSPSSA